MKRLDNVLNESITNSIVPFFWQHGENHETICEYMNQIKASGCGGVCIEARPHKEFAKEQWWNDVQNIVDKAKQERMEVWILDDSHFPTGYANGLVASKYPHLKKKYLDCRRFDVVGPMKYARMNLRFLKGKPWQQKGREEDKIIGIYVAKRADDFIQEALKKGENSSLKDPVDSDTFIDLTQNNEQGILYWDIPEGAWSIFVLIETYLGGEESTKDYLNPLVKEATEVLIEAVYEPHYQHFKDDFGTTITAFFSDEPRFGNAKGTDLVLGRDEMVLPWKDGLEEEIPFDLKCLPLLFADSIDSTMNRVRYKYMDLVSRLYSENFTQVLGEWCKSHGVKYVGHHIEDNGAHMRLGYGAGHIFRAQQGQSFSGIDVISNQIAPGYSFHHDSFSTGGHDGVFYHYALAHLGASIAELDPDKKGMAMCEAFGAYGWNEGLKWMKWISDHLMSRGINFFVPHAFNPKEYPDWDCPPHFYAHGHNPQFPYFSILMNYIQRNCHLLQGGIHVSNVAVLYPAEGEWCGEIQPIELILRELDQNQIESTIIPYDVLKDLSTEGLCVNGKSYSCLVIPHMPKIPSEVGKILLNIANQGIPVLFVNGYPEEVIEDDEIKNQLMKETKSISLDLLPEYCKEWKTVLTSEKQMYLQAYHYQHSDGEILFVFNEDPHQSIVTSLKINTHLKPMEYDAFSNQLKEMEYEPSDEHQISISLCLSPYESKMILLKKDWQGYSIRPFYKKNDEKKIPITGDWTLQYLDSLSCTREQENNFINIGQRDIKYPISCEEDFKEKSGKIRYQISFDWELKEETQIYLNLEEVYEIAEVFVNGNHAGVKICPSYCFEVTDFVVDGRNELTIDVTNTLGTENREFMSQYTPIEPFGLFGEVTLIEKSNK